MRGFLESHAIPPEISASSPPRIASALDMMRYQRVISPDCLPLSNGRKPTILRTFEEDDAVNAAARAHNYSANEAKPIIRARSTAAASTNPSPTRDTLISFSHSDNPPPIATFTPTSFPAAPTNGAQNGKHHEINGGGGGKGRDLLLQWGHNKRSRGSRSESRTAGDDPSVTNRRRTIKIRRRPTAEKLMPPPPPLPPPPPCGTYTRGTNLRPSLPSRDPPLFHHRERASIHHWDLDVEILTANSRRAVDERSSGQPRSERRSPPSPPERPSRKASANGCATPERQTNLEAKPHPPEQDPPAEKLEWPRIYVSLSRKEKEEDFLAMKGTKLPQRPKKRAKNIDKTLQYCFPGMWLSDLTRGRYEVREKKCVKKKRRGLKGMESIDSDSD